MAIPPTANRKPTPFDAAWYVFAVIGAAIAIDVSRIAVSVRAARRYDSAGFRSNAFNFTGDLAGSISVLVGLALVAVGFEQGDAIAALVVAALIFVAVARLIAENAGVLMDRAPDDARLTAERAVAELGPDLELRRLRLRESAGRFFVDVTVGVSLAAAVVEGHQNADRVEQAIRQALPGSDAVVHVEPRTRGLSLRQQVLATALSEPLVQEAHDITLFSRDGHISVSLHLKFPADLRLADAHDAAQRVERSISQLPSVNAVQTRLEPLEQLITERRRGPVDLQAQRRHIEALVRQQTGHAPRAVRLLPTDAGPVLFLTVALLDASALTAAHHLASRLEERLRDQQPTLTDVIIHTAPT